MGSIILAILVGVALSTASGLRIFLPLLAASIGARYGFLPLNESFLWLGSDIALIALSLASIIEISSYYIPVVDNALDIIGTPVAMIAGTFLTASTISELSPFLHWSLAIIAGGGSAAVVHSGTAALRAILTPSTMGLGNPVFSTGEAVASGTLSILAILFPIIAGLIAISMLIALILLGKKLFSLRKKKKAHLSC